MSVVLATAGYDHKIRFWEAPSGICSRIIKFSDSQVNRLVITPDKQFIAAAGNPTIRLYEIATAVALPVTSGNSNNKGRSTNSNNKSGGYNRNDPNMSASIVPPTQQPALTLEGHTGNVTSIGFQKDGQYLYSGSEDGTVKVWDLRNPTFIRSFNSGSAVNSVTLRYDRDEFISGDQNGYVKVWDLASGSSSNDTHVNNRVQNSTNNGCMASIQPAKATGIFHKKGRSNTYDQSNVMADNKNLNNHNNRINNPNRKKQSYDPYTEGITPIQSVDISEDSRTLVTITNRGTVFVWDPSNSGAAAAAAAATALENSTKIDNKNAHQEDLFTYLRPVTKFRATNHGTYCLHGKIAPDCRHLVTTASDGTAKLWDTITWDLTQTLDHQTTTTATIQHKNSSANTSSSTSRMQHQYSSLSSTSITGNNPTNDNKTTTITNLTNVVRKPWVWDAAFCADSSYLVTACSDHVARLWNLRTGDVVRQYYGHQSAVTCVALNDSSI